MEPNHSAVSAVDAEPARVGVGLGVRAWSRAPAKSRALPPPVNSRSLPLDRSTTSSIFGMNESMSFDRAVFACGSPPASLIAA